MPAWVYIMGQGACAAGAMLVIRRRLVQGIGAAVRERPEHAALRLLLDAWLPLALMAPLLALAFAVEQDVAGIGWAPLGAPVICAWAAVGFALLLRSRPSKPAALRPGGSATGALWIWSGAILLLLAAANELSVWVGQCIFALAGAVLWWRSPAARDDGAGDDAASAVFRGLFTIVLLAAAQGVFAWLALTAAPGAAEVMTAAPVPVAAASIAVMLLPPFAAFAALARDPGGAMAVRLGGWCAAYGVLFGVGLISLAHLLPATWTIATQGPTDVGLHVAYGFGDYAFEAFALIALAPLAGLLLRLRGRARRVAALVVLLLVLAGAAARLGMMPHAA